MSCLRLFALAVTMALTVSPALAGAKKQPAASIRVHAEGGAEGGNFSEPVELLHSKRKIHIQSLPLLTEREILSFHPFRAADGSYGAAFRLDSHGRNLLFQHTTSRRGSYVIVFMNGRRVTDLYVDHGVNDGIFTIPLGLTVHDISVLETSFARMGREKEGPAKPKKEKKPKASPTPAA